MRSNLLLLLILATLPTLRAPAQETPAPGEIERLVAELGSEDYGAREAAAARLREIGPAARAHLVAASAHADPEVRLRAASIVRVLDRRVDLGDALPAWRRRRLRLVSLDLDGADADELASALGEALGGEEVAWAATVDGPFSIRCRDLPLAEALDRLGLGRAVQPDEERFTEGGPWKTVAAREEGIALGPAGEGEAWVFAPGVVARFVRRPWPAAGRPAGWVVESTVVPDLAGDLDWRVAEVRVDGRPVEFDVCNRHGPDLLHVDGADPGSIEVVLAGVRRWYVPVEIDFDDPENGTERQAGPIVARLDWPAIELSCERPLPVTTLQHALSPEGIRWRLRPHVSPRRPGGRQGGIGIGGGAGGAFGGVRAWCGCVRAPDRAEVPRRTSRMRTVPAGGGAEAYSVDEIERVELTLRAPFEEPFRLESGPVPIDE